MYVLFIPTRADVKARLEILKVHAKKVKMAEGEQCGCMYIVPL